jgi:hypothetical protein
MRMSTPTHYRCSRTCSTDWHLPSMFAEVGSSGSAISANIFSAAASLMFDELELLLPPPLLRFFFLEFHILPFDWVNLRFGIDLLRLGYVYVQCMVQSTTRREFLSLCVAHRVRAAAALVAVPQRSAQTMATSTTPCHLRWRPLPWRECDRSACVWRWARDTLVSGAPNTLAASDSQPDSFTPYPNEEGVARCERKVNSKQGTKVWWVWSLSPWRTAVVAACGVTPVGAPKSLALRTLEQP